MKECPEGKILNPATNRCVDVNGKIGKLLKAATPQQTKKPSPKTTTNKKAVDCPKDKVLNPATNRCVDRKGKTGKAILAKVSPKKENKPISTDKLGKLELSQIAKHLTNSKDAAKLRVVSKTTKNAVDQHWEPSAASVRPMSLKDIKKQLPTNIKAHNDDWELVLDDLKTVFDKDNEEHVQKMYGPAATALTIDLAKSLIGQTIYVLEGHGWHSLENNNWNDVNIRIKDINQLKLVRFIDPFSNADYVNNSHAEDEPELELDDNTTLFIEEGKYVSGSGSDTFYVFIERRQAKHTGQQKQAKK